MSEQHIDPEIQAEIEHFRSEKARLRDELIRLEQILRERRSSTRKHENPLSKLLPFLDENREGFRWKW